MKTFSFSKMSHRVLQILLTVGIAAVGACNFSEGMISPISSGAGAAADPYANLTQDQITEQLSALVTYDTYELDDGQHFVALVKDPVALDAIVSKNHIELSVMLGNNKTSEELLSLASVEESGDVVRINYDSSLLSQAHNGYRLDLTSYTHGMSLVDFLIIAKWNGVVISQEIASNISIALVK